MGMPLCEEDIYRSSNDDRWRLISDPSNGRRFVRHEANVESGGQVTDTEIDDFLSINISGPEHTRLRQLLRNMGEDVRDAEEDREGCPAST
jgi:hypothetical protein